jgi:hypothetical protein
MKKTIGESEFKDAFKHAGRGSQFSSTGLSALWEYLEQYEQDTGEEIELDVIALCCEYSEFDSLAAVRADYTMGIDEDDEEEDKDKQTMKYLEDHTQVIPLDGGGVIIQQF